MSSQQTPAPADGPTSPLPACPVYECLQCDVRFYHPVANPGRGWYTDNYAASRGVTLARLLVGTKSALFSGIGRVLDAGLKAIGATGIYLYVLAQRPDVDGPTP